MTDTKKTTARRNVLKGAAVAAGAVAAPMIAKAQTGPISMRWQSTWPAKDIFHEYALDYAKTEQAGFKVGADFVWAKVAGIMLDAKTLEEARSSILSLRSKLKQDEKCQP